MQNQESTFAPIGIFDSGVGGFSVWREVVRQLPQENTLYFADQSHIPYGPRPLAEVRQFSTEITRFLLGQGAKLVVIACNTASGAALQEVRHNFPRTPIVGMEPAVKPATEQTRNGKVGVIATPATFQGELFQRLVKRFASDVRLYTQTCPGLVEAVESGALDTFETVCLLRQCVQPMLKAGIDQLVLGCTHYPFLQSALQQIVGPDVALIDPAPAVARQVRRVLLQQGRSVPTQHVGQHHFYTSGEPRSLQAQAEALLGYQGKVSAVTWQDNCITPN